MILNFYILNYMLNLVMFFSITFFIKLNFKFGYINVSDIFSRVQINDFFINLYYYYWTIFWYIPLFVVILALLLTSFSLKSCSKGLLFFTFLFSLVLLFECLDYWLLNVNYLNFELYSENFNILLTNSINKYHPFMFYSSVSLFFYVYFYSFSLINLILSRYRYCSQNFINFIKFYKLLYLYLISITLFLGSWWALQEGSWGGWWNWDPSEVFGLVVMLFILLTVHKNYRYLNFIKYFYDFRLVFLFLFFIYIFIQLNFNLISHNFSIRINQFINISQLFFIVIFSIFWLYTNLGKSFIRYNVLYSYIINFNMTFKKSKFISWTNLIIFLFFVIIFLSFYPLLSDFINQLLGFNLTNLNLSIVSVIIFFFIINYGIFFKIINKVCLLVLVLVFFNSNLLTISILFLSFVLKNTNIIHSLILFFLINSVFNISSILTIWGSAAASSPVNISSNLFFLSLNSLTITNNFQESFNVLLTNNFLRESIWNFFLKNSTPEAHFFYHSISDNLTTQSLLNGFFFQKFFINVFDFIPYKLLLIFILILVFINTKFFNNKLIVY